MNPTIVEIPIKFIGQDTQALVTAWAEGKELQGEYKFCLVKLDEVEVPKEAASKNGVHESARS